MARNAVLKHGLSGRLACECLGISETCYRYTPKLSGENGEIAHWLLTLTETHKRWGFGLCFAPPPERQRVPLEPQTGLPHLSGA